MTLQHNKQSVETHTRKPDSCMYCKVACTDYVRAAFIMKGTDHVLSS